MAVLFALLPAHSRRETENATPLGEMIASAGFADGNTINYRNPTTAAVREAEQVDKGTSWLKNKFQNLHLLCTSHNP